MRTLIVLSAFPPHLCGGGAEIAAIKLGKWLAAEGYTVGVITAADKTEPEWRGRLVDGMHVWRLRFPRPYAYWNQRSASKWQKPLWYLQDHFDPRNRALMASVLDEFRPDCVQIHVASGIGHNSLREIGRRNIPTVYVLHDLSLACVWGVMARNGKVCARQCQKCKIVSGIRFADVATIPTLALCSPSRASLEKLASLLPLPGPRSKSPTVLTTIIPNGIDLEEFKPDPVARQKTREEFGIPRSSKLLLFAGRDFVHKGLAHVIEALNDLDDDIWLLVAGSGDPAPYRRLLRSRQDRLVFAGLRSDMPALYAAADAFVLPTSSETFSLACMEAMASGAPVFATRVGGIDDYLEDGVNGYGIERNAANIAAKVRPVLRDENLLAALRKGAVATARKYAWDDIAGRHAALLRQVSKSRPSPLSQKSYG